LIPYVLQPLKEEAQDLMVNVKQPNTLQSSFKR
jgi:hypothetical protein